MRPTTGCCNCLLLLIFLGMVVANLIILGILCSNVVEYMTSEEHENGSVSALVGRV